MFKNLATSVLTLSALSLSLFSESARAQASDGVHTRIHHSYQSVRAMGMGNAFTAVTDDYAALFYNPAALARRDSGQINLSLGVGISSSFGDFFKDAQDADDLANTKTTDAEKFTVYSDFLQRYYGKTFMTRFSLFEGIWVRPNWGFGILPLDMTIEYKIHNQVSPALNMRVFADTTIAYGYGDQLRGVLPGNLSWGVTGKFVNRGYINRQFSAFDLAVNSDFVRDEDFRDGYTVDADLGILYTPRLPTDGIWYFWTLAKPTFALVVRNALETGFSQSFNLINDTKVEAPEKNYRVIDVGSKFEFPSFWLFGGRAAVDFKDILHPNYSFERGLHAGVEFDWTVASWWRGHYRIGVNQGYPTAGISALLFVFNLDLATYGEDVGTFNNPKHNRMYMLKASLDF
jgi:hypothetical protein